MLRVWILLQLAVLLSCALCGLALQTDMAEDGDHWRRALQQGSARARSESEARARSGGGRPAEATTRTNTTADATGNAAADATAGASAEARFFGGTGCTNDFQCFRLSALPSRNSTAK
jgi:hypothetical protein